MKVLHVLTVADSLIFLARRSTWMAARGVVTEVACTPDATLTRFGLTEQLMVHEVPMRRAISPIADLIAVKRLVQVLRSRKPDIVHSHTPKGGLLGMVAAWLTRVPVRLYHIHGLPFETATGLRRQLLIASEWVSCRLATEVMAVSTSVLDVAKTSGVCPTGKGVVLGAGSINGVDLKRFDRTRVREEAGRLRAELKIPAHASVVGFVGRLVYDKGLVTLADAWREVAWEVPTSVLLLVGEWERPDLVPAAVRQRLEKDERVFFTGFLEDPAPAYALMNVLAFPSRREGFGLAAIEAGAMGVPVVATDITGLRDAVKDGVTGTLVASDEPEALARALARYFCDPTMAIRHGELGYQRASNDFSPESLWDDTLVMYRSLVQKSMRG